MKCFSFSIYGDNKKYINGLIENIKIITEYYTDFDIYLYVGENSFQKELSEIKTNCKNVKITVVDNKNCYMCARYTPLITANTNDIVIIRDTDSEINERDRWCINDFLQLNELEVENSNCCFQIIRDHAWHKSKIMGGLNIFILKTQETVELIKPVIKKLLNDFRSLEYTFKYGDDESFLIKNLYPVIKDKALVYSNIIVYKGEAYKHILAENNGVNFCGNVVEYDNNNKIYKFNYFDSSLLIDTMNLLINNKQYDVMLKVIADFKNNNSIPENIMVNIIDFEYIAYFYKNNYIECMNCIKKYYKYTITDHIKNNTQFLYDLLKQNGYTISGTSDLTIEPKEKEIIIYYGNYPDDYNALPQSNQIYSNVQNFGKVKLTNFYYDKCWDNIDCIYIMGLNTNMERINRTMVELSHMNAPLNKVHQYIAKKDKNKEEIYLSVTKNHIDCIKHMKEHNYKCCLFLEDDIIFTSNYPANKQRLASFFERKYDYDICFLAASKLHKRECFDDLLVISKQECTTSSAYLLNDKTVDKVYYTINEGYELLKRDLSKHYLYCIDRYWCKLQNDNKMLIFKDKLAFQCPNSSNITGSLNYMLD